MVGPAVIVDPYSSGALFAPAFRAADVDVVAVVTGPQPPEVYAASYRPNDFPEIIVNRGDIHPIAERLRALAPSCLIPGCESGVELADQLAPHVVPNVSNVPELASARRHKGDMAAAVHAAGLPVIQQICTHDPGEVEAWIVETGLAGADIVVKPPKSASTDGVTRIPKGEGWRAVFDAMIGRPNRLGITNERLVVQEYVFGTEYVVDTFSYDGVHTVTDVCRYHKVSNGPHMAVYDTMAWVPPEADEVDELVTYASGVLDAVGLRFGAAHVELMMTGRGPRLIEIGARPHGGGQPRFCRHATGDSQIDRTVRYVAGSSEIPPRYELRSHTLVVFHMARRSGVVHNIEVLDAVEALPSHHFSIRHPRNGDFVPATSDLFSSLDFGFAVLSSTNLEQLRADYRRIRELEGELHLEDPALSFSLAAD